MNQRLTALPLALLLGLGLAACSSAPETGSVTIEVRAGSTTVAEQPLDVEVRDADGAVLAKQTMMSGNSLTLEGVPFGEITIEAIGLCELGTTLGAAGATAIFEPEHCTIA